MRRHPDLPRDAIADTRTSFDGREPGVAPIAGDATKVEELKQRPASGPEYVTTSTAKYDVHGRATESYDALGGLAKAGYTPAVGGPVTETVVTNALGHTTTSDLEPGSGQPLKITDPNKRVTETAYDALGREDRGVVPEPAAGPTKSAATRASPT